MAHKVHEPVLLALAVKDDLAYVDIGNTSQYPVNLEGYTLYSVTSKAAVKLPKHLLSADKILRVYTGNSDNAGSRNPDEHGNLYLGQHSCWVPGDIVCLSNGSHDVSEIGEEGAGRPTIRRVTPIPLVWEEVGKEPEEKEEGEGEEEEGEGEEEEKKKKNNKKKKKKEKKKKKKKKKRRREEEEEEEEEEEDEEEEEEEEEEQE
jgi:hypothetical protein